MDDLDHQIRQNERRLAENESQRQRLLGQVEGTFSMLGDDKVLVEMLRAQAWLRQDGSLVVTRTADGFKGVPSGWPESVPDPSAYVAGELSRRRDEYMRRFDAPSRGGAEPPPPSPSVARFRQMTGVET